MQIIRDKATQIVKYADATLLPDHVEGDGFVDYTTNQTNAETVEVDTLPTYFVGGAWKYDGAWTIVDQDTVDWYRHSLAPDSVSMRQARLQLLALGSYATVNGAISTMPEAAQIEWEYATEVQRSNPLVPAMAQLLGWTEDDTNLYFTEASKQ